MKDFSPKKYFEEATRLVKELNLDQALTNAGYGADDDKNLTGPSKNLLYRLQDHYHKKPKIRCAVIDGQKAALEQIQFCYDKNLQVFNFLTFFKNQPQNPPSKPRLSFLHLDDRLRGPEPDVQTEHGRAFV